MHTLNNHVKPRRQWPAVLAAVGMTLLVGLAVAALGINALLNQDVVPVEAAPADPAISSNQANIEQLQSLIAEYQSREQQYQQQLQQAADQLNSTTSELTQFQSLVSALQRAGVIQIAPDGRVFVMGGGFGAGQSRQGGEFEGDGD